MNDLEDLLTRTLRRGPAVDSPPGLLDAVHRRIRRRHVVRVGGSAAALAAVVVGVVAAVGAFPFGGGPGRVAPADTPSGAVPWTDRTAPPPTVPDPPGPPAAEYPACRAGQLHGAPGPFAMGAGQHGKVVTVTNTSERSCTLTGAPNSAQALRTDGTTLSLPVGSAPDGDQRNPANLQPGDSAEALISQASGCADPSTGAITRVSLAIPGSGDVTVDLPTNRLPVTIRCGLSISELGTSAPQAGVKSSPLDRLTVTTSMPSTLTGGAVAAFTVTLSNPTSNPIALSPCPSYAEYVEEIGIGPGRGLHRYYLNCQGAGGSIPAQSSVTFAMKVPVPPGSGPAKWGWMLQDAAVGIGGMVNDRG